MKLNNNPINSDDISLSSSTDDEILSKSPNIEQIPKANQNENNPVLLAFDPFFDEPKGDIQTLLDEVDNQMQKEETFEIDENKREIEGQNSVFTNGAKDRLQKINDYIKIKVPVLLEGPTGASKTLSAEIVCDLNDDELIRFNMSSEIKTQDLIGRYVGNENSWAGISQQDGPFSKAFQEGKVLLLDEINLASTSVLQCIEESLDSGVLSIEIPGRPLKKIPMHPNFRLIATQNPRKGSYANKRQNLGQKFYSRFQVINFPAFSYEELLAIGQGLAEQFQYDNKEIIKDLVSFHKKWSDKMAATDDIQCFTIREIAATIKAISQKQSIYDTIMTIYGARYEENVKKEINDLLKEYPKLCKDQKQFECPQFKGCFPNKSLKDTVKSVLFSLNNYRNVILTGKKECGKTQVALWISEYYNNLHQKDGMNENNDEKQSFFCFCSEEIKVADLIGHQAPSGKSDGTSEIIKWQDGFLSKAIKLGKCAVLESLDEAPSTVTERLNGLLDQKYDKKEIYFDIPENAANPKIKIKDSFRILATCDIDKIQQMSPAFLNRFDVIVLENQIDDNISDIQMNELITTLMNRYCSDLKQEPKNSDDPSEKLKNMVSSKFSNLIRLNIKTSNDNQPKKNNVSDFKYSPNIIPMIFEKVKNDKSISHISRICSSIIKLSYTFRNNKEIADKEIVEFAFLLLENNKNFKIPKEIKNELLGMLHDVHDSTDDPFFYKDSPTLMTFMAKLTAYSIIQQPICITGPTGVGKTSAAREFSRMRKHDSSSNSGFQMHSFHSNTKVSHFFGTTTLLDGQIVFHDGTLTKALKSGLVFIADEFNLSPQSVMKSLSLALDPTIGKNVFIPGIGQIINISSNFQCIVCQNDVGTVGRNAIPDSIASRFVNIDYPEPDVTDLLNICVSIGEECCTNKKIDQEKNFQFAQSISKYMLQINDTNKRRITNLFYIPPWSLRDITKIFRRIYSSNAKKFLNIDPIHHVLFYTLSSVQPKYIDKVFEIVKTILQSSFDLKDKIEEYASCYNAIPTIVPQENLGYYLMKNNIGIKIDKFEKLLGIKELHSLWNAIFKISLADKKEPILIVGNSGFKTFLAQLFLPKAQIITLNQETNVAQLLGSSGFMTNDEAKIFYIDNICKILRDDIKNIELRRDLENGTLTKQKVDDLIITDSQKNIPFSFNYALRHLSEKLFQNNDNKNAVLSNTTLEFRPGLFLNAILQGRPLILKDLANLPTIVLERFNELFSGKQNITLSEDIHDTFTPQGSKELTNFNSYFRVFATCQENASTRLSEAALSRFSVISIPEYSSDEQEIVLKSYIQINYLDFDIKHIDILKQVTLADLSEIKLHISFPQMIKVVEIASRLNQKTSPDEKNKQADYKLINIGRTFFRVLGGILRSKKSRSVLFEKLKTFFHITDDNIKNTIDECQLIIQEKENTVGVLSKISNLFLKCSVAKESLMKVSFTNTFNDLLDLIHMGLTIHNPIILEGPPGQGKHTAINFVADMLGIDVVRIMISQTTKVEDLFGKDTIISKKDGIHIEMVETQFIKIIKSTNGSNKRSLIVLENINSASPALLNALVPVFNAYSTTVLLPNGNTIQKGTFDIIAIFNTQQSSSNYDKLPSSLIHSSIYHIVSNSEKDEILNIILTKFDAAKFSQEEALYFSNNYNNAIEVVSKEGLSSELFTLNDIDKYLLFRQLTKNVFDKTTISQMIFAYRFSNDDMIQKMISTLKLEKMKFNPIFGYNLQKTDLFIKLSNDNKTNNIDESNNDNNNNDNDRNNDNNNENMKSNDSNNKGNNESALLLPLINPPEDQSIISTIESLTLPQKHCLIFLICSVLVKRACVIQGDTASGKSYLIRLLAKLVGAELNVFQMNADCNVSLLAGQSILKDSLSVDDTRLLKKAFSDLNNDDQIKKYMNDSNIIDFDDERSLTPKIVKNLLKFIESIESTIASKKYYPEIEKAVEIIKKVMNPVSRFEHQESAFINAIKNGQWVLIDGIESAPSVIAEKISSLCGENPELNLYEFGPKFFYSRNDKLPKENQINKNFHLFITYNPNSIKESQMIDQTFLVNSVTFTLPPFDDKIENSAQMLLGSFINLSYRPQLSKQLAVRFASMHDYAKKQSEKNPDSFSGGIQYNGRTLKFITKAFPYQKEKKDVPKSICFSTKSFYLNSYIDQEKYNEFRSKCREKFNDNPKNELLMQLKSCDMDPRERNENILLILRNIQRNVLGLDSTNDYKLELNNFVEICSHIPIYDLPYINDHIDITFSLIKACLNDKYMIKYGTIFAVSQLIKPIINPESPIKKEHTSLTISDAELKNNNSITTPILKFDLLFELLSNDMFSENASILLANKTKIDLLIKITVISMTNTKDSFLELFADIAENNDLIDYIVMIFPFLKFNKSSLSMICYWLPLFQQLIKNKVHFSFTIDGSKFEFNEKIKSTFSIDLIMNEKDSFSLSENSTIYFQTNNLQVPEHQPEQNKDIDLLHYAIISEMLKHSNKIIDDTIMEIIISNINLEKIQNNYLHSILSISDLFNNKNSSLISFIWNLLYTLPESVIDSITKIINPIEYEMLLSASKMLQKIDQKIFNDILSWCQWAQSFDKKTEILKSIVLESNFDYYVNTDDMISNINSEINYLKISSDLISEFWTSEKLIKLYQPVFKNYKEVQEKNENKSKEAIIRRKLKELQQRLIDIKITNGKYIKMKAEFIDQIDLITEFTDEKLNSATYVIEKFISDTKNMMNTNDNVKNSIIWPNISFKNSYSTNIKTQNIKLFEALVWYAQIKAILKEINEGNDLINNLWKLNDFPEMKYPRKVFLSYLIQHSNSQKTEFTIEDKKTALGTLNANMILKLYDINESFLSEPEKIFDIINDYENRSSINENELRWVYSAILDFPDDFIISIPRFHPKDLIYAIINKKSQNEFRTGPFFAGVQSDILFENIKPLFYRDFDSFTSAAQSIGEIVYQTIINKNEDPPKDYSQLKKSFLLKNEFKKNELAIHTKTLKIFEFADNLSKWINNENQKLLFNDITFLSSNWEEDSNLLNTFPSLVFWLFKNKKCADQIKNKFGDFKPMTNEIPFWLISLRFMSSIDCLEFDSESHTRNYYIINDSTTSVIKEFLIKSKENKSSIDFAWINILISNLSPQISQNIDPSIKLIHDFFNYLTMDSQMFKSEYLNNVKDSIIYDSISDITHSLLINKLQSLIEGNILDNKLQTFFLSFPSKYIKNKIDNSIYDVYSIIIGNESTKKLKKLLSNTKNYDRIVQKLENQIKTEEEEMKQSYQRKIAKNSQKRIKRKCEDIQKFINIYNEIVYKLIHFTIGSNGEIYNLKYYRRQLDSYPDLFKNEGITLVHLEYYSSSDEDIQIRRNGKLISYIFKNTHYNKREVYLFPGETFDSKDNYNSKCQIKILDNVSFNYIKQEYDLYNIVSKHYNIAPTAPILIFGDQKQTSNEFTFTMNSLGNNLRQFNSKIIEEIEKNNQFSDDSIEFIKKTSNLINILIRNLQVTDSNGSQLKNINGILQGEMKEYLEDLLLLLNKFINSLQKNLYPILSALKQNQESGKIFNYNYDVQIPKINPNIKKVPDFSSIKNVNSLATPIISISHDKKIICSVNKIKCNIAPIIPSQSSEPYSINIISFINQEATIEITDLNDSNCNEIIKTSKKIKKYEPIKISVKPLSVNEPITKKITGNILIKPFPETNAIKEKSLPFEIILGIVPLKVRLRCIEFPLVKEQNYLRLCCDKVDSNSQINIEVINYYIQNSFLIAFDLEPLEDNEANKPELSMDDEKKRIIIHFQSVKSPTRCKFNIKIALSQNFVCTILCDLVIMPIAFAFEAYNFTTRQFERKECPIILINDRSQLILRIQSMFPSKKQAIISHYFPKSIKLISSINLDEKIDIFDNLIIPINITFDNHSYDYKKPTYAKITLNIDGVIRYIEFTFIINPYFPFSPLHNYYNSQNNNEFMSKYPCYYYKEKDKSWQKIIDNNKLIELNDNTHKPYIIVSPFSEYSIPISFKFTIINYQYNYYVVASPSKHIKYIQLTKPIEDYPILQEKLSVSYKTNKTSGYFFATFHCAYFSIIGFDQNNPNFWFPVFDQYPNINNINFLPYTLDKENIDIAKSNIKVMLSDVFPSHEEVNINDSFTSDIKLLAKQTNFVYLMTLLLDKDIVINIKTIIDKLPDNLQDKLVDILSDLLPIINSKDQLCDDMFTIISHNLIIKFIQVFSDKYLEIQSHDFLLDYPLSKEEVEKQKINVINEFFNYDRNKETEKSIKTQVEFSQILDDLQKIDIPQISDKLEHQECFIISEKEHENPTPCKTTDKFEQLNFDFNEETESGDSNNIDEFTYLPPINIPETFSILSLNDFYSTCSQGAIVLPTYIKCQSLKPNNQKESELYFAKLLDIYIEITKASKIDKSIVSSNVSYFIDSFKNCVGRLRRAGISFKNISLPQSCYSTNQNYNQDCIHYPSIKAPYMSNIQWKTKSQFSKNIERKQYIDPSIQNQNYQLDTSRLKSVYKNPFSRRQINLSKTSDTHSKAEIEIAKKNRRAIIAKVLGNETKNTSQLSDKKDTLGMNSSNDQEIPKKPLLKVDYDSKNVEIRDSKEMKGILDDFNDIDRIKMVVRRITELKENKNASLKFLSISDIEIKGKEDLFKPDNNDIANFPVKELIDNSQFLIAKLISKASDQNCPFLKMYCNLLFDISSFISPENKLYNFMLLVSFSYALYALEIPFSIAIVADQKFKYELKSFDEKISIVTLQRVLDCTFVQRFKSNIPDAIHHAIENMKYPLDDRTQRCLFFFSNGIDENIVLAESWKELILNNANNSFGLIFSKTDLIDKDDNAIIESMWNDFSETVKDAASYTKLTYFNLNVNKETIDLIASTFADVLSQRNPEREFNDFTNKADFEPNFIQVQKDLTKKAFDLIKSDLCYDFDDKISSFFRQSNPRYHANATKFQKLKYEFYKDKVDKITKSSPEAQIKEEFGLFIHKIVHYKTFTFKPLLEAIFRPNKASQTILSSTGTDFDITALILNLINPVPDPLIYLEEKGGLIRNYGVSIIIDSSKSCFSPLSSSHSYQTIKVLFAALSSIEIPCIDVIIATDSAPIVLSSETSSSRLFNSKSTFWPSLFSCLAEARYDKCDLESALHAAYDIRKMRSIDSTSYMFVLTDGLYQNEQKELIKNHVMTCIQSGFSIFGIGIGIYPRGIIDMFPNTLFATNPNQLIHGIASFFGDQSIESYNDSIKHLAPEPTSYDKLKKIFGDLNHSKDHPIFSELKKIISDTQHALDAFSFMYNSEIHVRNANNELVNPEDNVKNSQIYVENALKGQKILFCSFYDRSVNSGEHESVNPMYLSQPFSAGGTCLTTAVQYFGIEVVLVKHYEDAIEKLTKDNGNGKCEFYAVWFTSSNYLQLPLPENGSQYYADQFVDCVIDFWKKGGSVVALCDNDPFTFLVNLFLERIRFPGIGATNLRVHGFHKGMTHLKADPSGELKEAGTFNSSPIEFERCHRAPLSHNLVDIYEGVTIAYAPDDPQKYAPFTPFMRDSQGGISSLYYAGDNDYNSIVGDIIIDCGYTKLFNEMTESGTARYIQNIAAWTAQCESKLSRGIRPELFRPEKVEFNFDPNRRYEDASSIFVPIDPNERMEAECQIC